MAGVDDELAKLRKDIDQIRNDVGTLTSSFKELGLQKGHEAVDRAKRTGSSMRKEAEAWRAKADHEIEERPLTSVLVSFGVGFLIGRLLDRRH